MAGLGFAALFSPLSRERWVNHLNQYRQFGVLPTELRWVSPGAGPPRRLYMACYIRTVHNTVNASWIQTRGSPQNVLYAFSCLPLLNLNLRPTVDMPPPLYILVLSSSFTPQ